MTPEQIIERERRWAGPAAIGAFAAVLLLVGSLIVAARAIKGDTGAEQLRHIDAHASTLVLSGILRGVGFAAMITPLVYLFEAARARSALVRRAFVGLCVLGPVLFAVQAGVDAAGTRQAAADFVKRSAAAPEQSVAGFLKALRSAPDEISKVTFYPDKSSAEVEQRDGVIYPLDLGSRDPDRLDKLVERQGVSTEVDESGDPGDVLVEDVLTDSTVRQLAQNLLFPALLTLIAALIYTSLQAMRVGLLTRFFGTLGMALGAAMIVIGFVGVTLFIGALGFLIAGWWPGPRPPAWDAGEAIPWLRPGQEPAQSAPPEGTIEGTAAEVGGAEAAPGPARPGPTRRKRKRRR